MGFVKLHAKLVTLQSVLVVTNDKKASPKAVSSQQFLLRTSSKTNTLATWTQGKKGFFFEQYQSPVEQYPEFFLDLLPAELPFEWNSDTTASLKCTSHPKFPNPFGSECLPTQEPPSLDSAAGGGALSDDNSSVGGSPQSVARYYSPGPEPVTIPMPIEFSSLEGSIITGPVPPRPAIFPVESKLEYSPAIAAFEAPTPLDRASEFPVFDPRATPLPSPVVPMTSTPVIVARSDTTKARERRARNTEAARRSRGRVKNRISELEALVEQLTAENRRLAQENEWLKKDCPSCE